MKSIVTFLFIVISSYSLQAGTVSDLAGDPYTQHVQLTETSSFSGPPNIRTYPNPFQHELTIEMEYTDQPVQIRLFNVVGKVLLQQTAQGTVKLDVSTLAPGTYYLKVEAGSESTTRRIVKY